MDKVDLLCYEDISIGDEIPPLVKNPTLNEIKIFCRLYQEPEPNRFTDIAVAKKQGVPFLIIPGGLTIAYLSQLIIGWSPTISISRLDVIFRGRIKQKDIIHCRGLVTDKEVRQNTPYIDCDVFIEDSSGQRPITGKATIQIPSRS